MSDPGGRPLASDGSYPDFGVGFVAVNSNWGHLPAGTYQAQTSVVQGSGSYGMEYSNPRRVLSSSSPNVWQSISMGPGEFITTSDVWLNAGQTYSFANDFCGGIPNCWNVLPNLWGVSAIMPSTGNVVAGLGQALTWCGGYSETACHIGNTVPSQSGWYAVVTIVVNRPYNVIPSIEIPG